MLRIYTKLSNKLEVNNKGQIIEIEGDAMTIINLGKSEDDFMRKVELWTIAGNYHKRVEEYCPLTSQYLSDSDNAFEFYKDNPVSHVLVGLSNQYKKSLETGRVFLDEAKFRKGMMDLGVKVTGINKVRIVNNFITGKPHFRWVEGECTEELGFEKFLLVTAEMLLISSQNQAS